MKNRKTVTVILILLLAVMLTAIITSTVRGFRSVELVFRETESISGRDGQYVALRANGTLAAAGVMPERYAEVYAEFFAGCLEVDDLADIVQVICTGDTTYALHADGSISVRGALADRTPEQWEGVVSMSHGILLSAIRSDGEVLAAHGIVLLTEAYGEYKPIWVYPEFVRCSADEVQDAVQLVRSLGCRLFILREDGRVFATEMRAAEEEYFEHYALDWQGIIHIELGDSSDSFTLYGLKSDGTVVAVGDNQYGQREVSDWRNVVQLRASEGVAAALRSDGTVVIAGGDWFTQEERDEIATWENIVEIRLEAGKYNFTDGDDRRIYNEHTGCLIALSADGTVHAVGSNRYGQCDVDEWQDIVGIYTDGKLTFGLRSDGTVLTAGVLKWGACDVSHWTDVRLPEGME